MANGELAVSASDMKEYVESLGFSYDDIQEVGGTVQLRRGICLDWSLYPILRVNLGGSKSLVGKLAKSFGLSLSLEILGDDDTFLKGHIDFPSALANMVNSDSLVEGAAALLGIGATCTYDFTPWTPLEGEIEDPTESTEPKDPDEYDIPVSGSLVLSSMRVFLDMDDVYYLEVTGMPKGYSLDDLIVVSEDESIAKFDKNFSKIVPVAPGTTQITVKTKDDKYKAFLAVTISEVAESKGITGTSYIIC
jgi:hypothetical protein